MRSPDSLAVLSVAGALPRTCVSNARLVAQLAQKGVETSAEWIESRTGITQRYICAEGENTATLATQATQKALEKAGITPQDVDILVVGTCTPARVFPSTAALIHGALGLPAHAAVLDVNAACSGFLHSLAVAQGLLRTLPHARTAVVVGADVFSPILDWADRSTCVLFGDGAGALVLSKTEAPNTGLLGVSMGANGALADALTSTGHGVTMNGREVFKNAVRHMGTAPALLAQHGLTLDNMDWFVPHQANARILSAAAEGLGVPQEKVIQTVQLHANTSAASIPLALAQASQDGRIQKGQLLLLQAFGAGLTWSEALLRW